MSNKSYSPARHAAVLSRSYATNATPATYNQAHMEPFGPHMAHHIFDVSDWGDAEDYASDSYVNIEAVDCGEIWYQPELPLENVRDLEEKHRQAIKKFDRAYRKMMVYALQWHYLMEECEENAQLAKQFKDIQLIRKLNGSDRV